MTSTHCKMIDSNITIMKRLLKMINISNELKKFGELKKTTLD